MNSHTASAPGKVMLAGEYSVLFGGTALVAPIDRMAQAQFKPADKLAFFSKTTDRFVQNNEHPLWQSVVGTQKNFALAMDIGAYSLDTSAFFDESSKQKLGLGSSAAGVVALSKLLLKQRDQNKLLRDYALKAHEDFSEHLGSGADVLVSSWAEAIFFRRNNNNLVIHPIDLRALWPHLVFIHTKREQNTRDFVAQALAYAQQDNQALLAFTSSSNLLTAELARARHSQEAGETINELYALLKNFGERAGIDIISKEHQEIYFLARRYGGSAKPSGAGGGDLSIAVVPKEKEAFLEGIKTLGFATINLALHGSR